MGQIINTDLFPEEEGAPDIAEPALPFQDTVEPFQIGSPSGTTNTRYDNLIEDMLEKQREKREAQEVEATNERARMIQADRESFAAEGIDPQVSAAGNGFSLEEVQRLRDDSPTFYEFFSESDPFAAQTLDKVQSVSSIERTVDYFSDIHKSARVGVNNLETAARRWQHMTTGEISEDSLARLNFLQERGFIDREDIGETAGGALRGEWNPLTWVVYAAEQGANTAGAGISALAGALTGSAVGPGGTVVGGISGLFGFGAFIESGLMFDQLVREREARGEDIDVQELRNISLVVGGINGALEAVGQRLLFRTLPKPIQRKLGLLSPKAAVRRIMGQESTQNVIRGAVGTYLASVAGEAGTEATQELFNSIGAEYDRNGFNAEGDIIRFMGNSEVWQNSFHAAVRGAQAAAVLGAGGTVLEGRRKYNESVEGQTRAREIAESKSKEINSVAGLEQIAELNRYAKEHKDGFTPEMREYIARVMSRAESPQIHIDAKEYLAIMDELGTASEAQPDSQADDREGVVETDEEGRTTVTPGASISPVLADLEDALEGMGIEDLEAAAEAGESIPVNAEAYVARIAVHDDVVKRIAPKIKLRQEHLTIEEMEGEAVIRAEQEETRREQAAVYEEVEVEGDRILEEEILPAMQAQNEGADSPLTDEQVQANAVLEANAIKTAAVNEGISVQEAAQKYGKEFVAAEAERDILGQPVVREALFQRGSRNRLDPNTGVVTRTMTPRENEFMGVIWGSRPDRQELLDEVPSARFDAEANTFKFDAVDAEGLQRYVDDTVIATRTSDLGGVPPSFRAAGPENFALFQMADTIEVDRGEFLAEAQTVELRRDDLGRVLAPNGEVSNLNEFQARVTRTPLFKKWFGGSKVVDDNGEPMVVFHGTRAGEGFGEFFIDRQMGAHFGTPVQAETRVTSAFLDRVVLGGRIAPVFLRINNPVHIDDVGDFDRADQLADTLQKEGGVFDKAITKGAVRPFEESEFDELIENAPIGEEPGVTAQLGLKEKGFDGAVYLNRGEEDIDPETGNLLPSYIVFDSDQIAPALAFPGAPDVMFQAAIPDEDAPPIKGFFTPGNRRTGLTPSGDVSTFGHEMAHGFMFDVLDRAKIGDERSLGQLEVIMDWLGVDTLDDLIFNENDTEAQTESKTALHEKFADGNLLYLAEGNAPSVAMQSVFDRFREWLSVAVKRIQESGIELNDEIRAVYGQFLVADAELATAHDAMTAHQMTQEQLQMSDEQYARYIELIDDAVLQARKRMDSKIVRDANKLKSKAYRERKKVVKAEVTAEVEAEQVYRARSVIMRVGGRKLRSEEVAFEMQGQPDAGAILSATKNALMKDGDTASLLAEEFGYKSVYELLRDMAFAPKKKDEIDRRVSEVMTFALEERDDIVLPDDSTTSEAQDALHNSSWENAIRAEISALELSTGRRSSFPIDVLKENAKRMIAGTRLNDLNPNSYVYQGRLASNRAFRAMESGDRDTALDEKSSQLLNQYLAREAFDKEKKSVSQLKRLQRLNTKGGRTGIDESFLPHIVGVLDRFDLRRAATGEELVPATPDATREFIKGLEQDGENVRINDDDQIYQQRQIPWHQLTVEQFDQFARTMENIKKLGKNIRTVTLDGITYDLSEVSEPIIQNLQDNLDKKPSAPPGATARAKIEASLTSYWVELRKRRNIARKIDGGKPSGAAQEILIANMSKAQGAEEKRLETEYEALREIFERNGLNAKTMGQKKTFAGGGLQLSYEQVLSVALNYGNADNRQRITETVAFFLAPGTERIAEESAAEIVQDVLAAVKPEHWATVQEVWDYLDTFWQEVAELEHRTTGVVPKRVEPISFESPTGTEMRGGYYPLTYDPRVTPQSTADDKKAEAFQTMTGFAASAMTAHGHTKERLGSGGRIVKMELSVMFNHIGQVVHDLTHRETLNGLNRIIRDKEVQAEMVGRLGPEDYTQWQTWIQRTAIGDERASTEMERWAGKLRGRVTVMGLGLNFSTAALQLMGLTQSQVSIGGKWVGAATGEYMANRTNPKAWRAAIDEKSHVMKSRGTSFNRDIRELQKQVSKNKKLNWWESAMFSPIVAMQSIVDSITWTAGYNRAIFEGDTEKRAIERGDDEVIRTQGSGRIADLAGIEGGRPFLKLFTTFYSFMNTMFNLNVDQFNEIWNSDRALAIKMFQQAQSVFMLYILPATFTSYVLDILIAGEEPEDEEAWLKWLGQNNMNFFVGQFPFLREAVPSGYRYSGPAGLRFFESLQRGIVASVDLAPGGEPFGGDDVDGLLEDPLEILNSSDARAIIDATGVALPLPTTEIKRFLAGLQDIAQGDVEGPVDAATGLFFRKAR